MACFLSLGIPARGLELIASIFVVLRLSSAARIETQQIGKLFMDKEKYLSETETPFEVRRSVIENPSLKNKLDHPITLLEKPVVRDNHPPQNSKEVHLMLTLDFLHGEGSSVRPYDVDGLFTVILFSNKLRISSKKLQSIHYDVGFPQGIEVDPARHRIQYNRYGLHLQDGMLFEDQSPKLVVDVPVTDQKNSPPVRVVGKELRHVNPIVDAVTKLEFNTFVDAVEKL